MIILKKKKSCYINIAALFPLFSLLIFFPFLIFLITPIMPEGKKIYETIQKESIKITKIYPAFTGKQQVELSSGENTQATNQQPKTVVVQKKLLY